jgi:hypothetical protein
MLCDSCDCVFINNVKCHEHGCPDAWKDKKIECAICEEVFKPVEKGQKTCSLKCTKEYFG